MSAPHRARRWHRYWDKKSGSYDAEMRRWDQRLFGDSRSWACSRASGATLEVAVGSGLNLPEYPASVRLTGIDLSERMLDLARARAAELDRQVELRQANAHQLPFGDAEFDTVVCTFGLCAIPDPHQAVREMIRVLRSGGALVLVDHVRSTSALFRTGQWLLERITVPLGGEHFLRRPRELVEAHGLRIEEADRFKRGIVERLIARQAPVG
ncbi:class I SAM-dependent methyltransferase [Tamaricihabitans halophyticus]|nr:methyltransferase domain-containing protein [Tamaricihabitans halophyticus]